MDAQTTRRLEIAAVCGVILALGIWSWIPGDAGSRLKRSARDSHQAVTAKPHGEEDQRRDRDVLDVVLWPGAEGTVKAQVVGESSSVAEIPIRGERASVPLSKGVDFVYLSRPDAFPLWVPSAAFAAPVRMRERRPTTVRLVDKQHKPVDLPFRLVPPQAAVAKYRAQVAAATRALTAHRNGNKVRLPPDVECPVSIGVFRMLDNAGPGRRQCEIPPGLEVMVAIERYCEIASGEPFSHGAGGTSVGPLAIEGYERTLVVARSGSIIKGRILLDGDPKSRGIVRLAHFFDPRLIRQERVVEVDKSGAFLLADCLVGRKKLRLMWQEAGGTIHFDMYRKELAKGEVWNLGLIRPRPDLAKVHLTVGSKSPVEPRLTAEVFLNSDGNMQRDLMEHFVVPLGERRTITGLDPGHYWVEYGRVLRGGRYVEGKQRSRKFEISGADVELDLDLPILAKGELQLTVAPGLATTKQPLSATLIYKSGDTREVWLERNPSGEHRFEGKVPAGELAVVCRFVDTTNQVGYVALARGEVKAGSDVSKIAGKLERVEPFVAPASLRGKWVRVGVELFGFPRAWLFDHEIAASGVIQAIPSSGKLVFKHEGKQLVVR